MAQEHKYNSATPLFSIVIPTYNHGHLIGRCLDSVVGQSCGDWEAIVVNNFSEDNTVEVVEGYHDSRIRLINFANNGIIAASRNKGISEARGEWICFLDSDDWWTPDKLEACLPYLDEYDMIYHDLQIYQASRHKVGRRMRSRQIMDYSVGGLLSLPNPIANSSVVLRRSVTLEVGPLTELKALIAVEDFDYWIRVMQYSQRVKYIPHLLGYYYQGQNISASLKQIERMQALLKKYIPSINPARLRRTIAWFEYNYARFYHLYGKFVEARHAYLQAWNCARCRPKIFVGYLLALLHIKV